MNLVCFRQDRPNSYVGHQEVILNTQIFLLCTLCTRTSNLFWLCTFCTCVCVHVFVCVCVCAHMTGHASHI